MKRFFIKKSGVSAIPATILISGIIIEIAIAGAVIANSVNNTRFGERLSAEALSAARSGGEDAILRTIRYKNCPMSPECPASYTISVGNRTADVTISANTPSTDQITIDSVGTAFFRQKKVRVVLGVNPSTGEVKMQSFGEIQL